jgi:hypothetical protein
MTDFSTGARVRVAGGAGLSGGGATVEQVDTAISTALTALTIPAAINDLSDVDTTGASDGDVLTHNGTQFVAEPPATHTLTDGRSFIIDGGGSTITTGVKGDIEIPFACTITAIRLFADQTGSINVQIWRDAYANYPPTVADLIADVNIFTSTKNEYTGLTTVIAAGSVLRFNVNTVTSHQRVAVALTYTRDI